VDDILAAMDRIQTFTRGMTFDEFAADEKTVQAVEFNLMLIGEAARNIPSEIKERAPSIRWVEITGLRNVIVHEYFGLSVRILWDTSQRDLAEIRPPLEELRRRI
jgi:uncharacterized protein with HEPN domain